MAKARLKHPSPYKKAAQRIRATKKHTSLARSRRSTGQKKTPFGLALGLYLGVVVIAGISAAALAQTRADKLGSPFRPEQLERAAFQVYYPAQLPAGLHSDPASVSAEAALASIRIIEGAGHSNRNFTVIQQPLPPNYDIETFHSSLEARTTAKTSFGTAVIGTIDAGKTRVASLITEDKTWILIQAASGITAEDLSFTLQHLAEAAPRAPNP